MDYGVSSLAITNWLGHEDDQVTRRHYLGYNDAATSKKFLEDLPTCKNADLKKFMLSGGR